jgi:hypothetical protein
VPHARALAHLAEPRPRPRDEWVVRADVLRGRSIFLLLMAVDDSLIVIVTGYNTINCDRYYLARPSSSPLPNMFAYIRRPSFPSSDGQFTNPCTPV